MAATLVRRAPMEPQQPSRAAQRKQRLLELENEQRLEDLEALKMTEEQRLILFHSFRSVKFEWSDLDGLRYVRRRYNSPPVHPPAQTRARSPAMSPRPPTIQVAASPLQAEPFYASPPGIQQQNQRPPPIVVPFPSTPVPFPSADSAPASPTPTITPRDAAWGNLELDFESSVEREPIAKPVRTVKSTSSLRTRRLSSTSLPKGRSPMKGLFPTPATPAAPVPSIVVPQLLGSSSDSESDEDESDEDAWVDEDDEDEDSDGDATFVLAQDDDDEEDEEYDELATPVAPRSWQFEDALGVCAYSVAPPTPTPTDVDAEFHVGGNRRR